MQNAITWRSPSNIALIKYWGKKDGQLPENPSLSFVLKESFTKTRIRFKERTPDEAWVDFSFEGKPNAHFNSRIIRYFHELKVYMPVIQEYHFNIESENSFPHSSGIASSASAFSSMALCLASFYQLVTQTLTHGTMQEMASFIARIGSGSAARSVFPGFSLWGNTSLVDKASDEYAVPLNHLIHPKFFHLRNAILIVSSKSKAISSSEGHQMMNNHPFADSRYKLAHRNLRDLLNVLKDGNEKEFFKITEHEANILHSLLLSSMPGVILMKPQTIEIINAINSFRQKANMSMGYTLDAGANVHLLYFEKDKISIHRFIREELTEHLEDEQWIDDGVGEGPLQIRR